jgi:hypothetical protein
LPTKDLHYHTKDGKARPFWDDDNQSIQALAERGCSSQFAFSYDWHWRAEENMRGRGQCPATIWPKSVKNYTAMCLRIFFLRWIFAHHHWWNLSKTSLLEDYNAYSTKGDQIPENDYT